MVQLVCGSESIQTSLVILTIVNLPQWWKNPHPLPYYDALIPEVFPIMETLDEVASYFVLLKHNLTKTYDVGTRPSRMKWCSTNCCTSI
jgi:hypothetical protein